MTVTAHRPIDGRTTRHPAYTSSQTIRRWIEECFGWAKTIGGLRKSRFIGREKLDFQFVMTLTAYNLIRMRNLGVVSCRMSACRGVGPSTRPNASLIDDNTTNRLDNIIQSSFCSR